MRVAQPIGTRGSLKWMQRLVRDHATLLDDAICATGMLKTNERVEWVSPRSDDQWAEYRDGSFLAKVKLGHLRPALAEFWPKRGPQWDALGMGSAGTVVLVEAKAHIGELRSTCTASPTSRDHIERSLGTVKAAMGAPPSSNWLTNYYQYANRLAHLHLLQSISIPTALVFIYFTHDAEMPGPNDQDAWNVGVAKANTYLGLSEGKQVPCVASIYIDTRVLV